jgi:uncharacterized protein YbcI
LQPAGRGEETVQDDGNSFQRRARGGDLERHRGDPFKALRQGADEAKTYLLDDVVMTVMEDVFTTVEHTLIEHGKGELVREVRTTFQYTMREEFIDAVRQITGRDARAFISQIDCDADIAVEVFLLANGVTDVTQNGGEAS